MATESKNQSCYDTACEQLLNWIELEHDILYPKLLTEEYLREPTPEGFKGTLFAPQQTMLHAMLNIERRQSIKIGDKLLTFNKALISAQFSFGKTVLMLSLVCKSPIPKVFPMELNHPLMRNAPRVKNSINHTQKCETKVLEYSTNSRSQIKLKNSYDFRSKGFGVFPSMQVKYRRSLKYTLVIAASSVLSEWINNIQKFTDYGWFIVDNVFSLKKFYNDFHSNKLGEIQFVLVKVGKVTNNFRIPGESPYNPKYMPKQRPMVEALGLVTEGCIWARVIVDDFDTINLTCMDMYIPAHFTWLISATRKQRTVSINSISTSNIESFLQNHLTNLPYISSVLDNVLYGPLNLRCEQKFVNKFINGTRLSTRKIVVPGGQMIRHLHNLGVPDDIVEMLSSGAHQTAASRLGIEAESITDVVKAVLKDRLKKFRIYSRMITQFKDLNPSRDVGTKYDENKWAISLWKGTKECKPISHLEFTSKTLTHVINMAISKRNKIDQSLKRMRDNIAEEGCQSCTVPFEGGCYIINCCQVLICEDCIYENRSCTIKSFIKTCPNCAVKVDPKNSLIYLSKDFDLEDLLEDSENILNSSIMLEEGNISGDDNKLPISQFDQVGDLRIRALLQLMRGETVNCISNEEYDINVSQLINGKNDIPLADDAPKKWLIFGVYSETSRKISEELTRFGFNNLVLHGSRISKTRIKNQFKDDPNIIAMIVTASEDCAGMHLPFVTHQVLTHKIMNISIRNQAIARAHRIGRTCNLQLYQIENEVGL